MIDFNNWDLPWTVSSCSKQKKAPRRTDYCDVCEQTFQNGRHFYAHLKWKKHKRLCRVARLLRGQLKKTPEEVANDPLGSFTLYMNKGKYFILENSFSFLRSKLLLFLLNVVRIYCLRLT